MAIKLGDPPKNEKLETLLKAAETAPPSGIPAVAPCPLSQKDKEKKLPIRLVFWNIFELGGGFYMPSTRPQYVIDAYATLLQKLNLHVIVLTGLTRTIQDVPTLKGAGADAYIALNPEPKDTGPDEAKRILKKLQEVDGGAGWKMVLPQERASSDYLYHRWTTAAFLYASAKSITFQKIDIVESAVTDAAGLTGTLLAATFDAPPYQSLPLCVVTALGLSTPERPWEKLRIDAPEPERKPTAPMPDSAILFLSAPGDAAASLSNFQAEIDAEFVRPGLEGTVLGDEFWKTVSESKDGLLGNFTAVNLGNVILQDEEMHWEALEDPAHAKAADKLPGYLADGMSILHQRLTPPPKLQELRVIDLLAAALPAGSIEKLKAKPIANTADGGAPPENSAITAQFKSYHEDAVSGPEPKDDPANELSECGYFTRVLSRHWPVVTQLLLEPE